MKVVTIQPTPNPNAFKFVLDGQICHGALNFPDREQAKNNALATKLFEVAGVQRVFLCETFITLTMDLEADWHAVHAAATEIIETAEDVSTSTGTDHSKVLEDADLSDEDRDMLIKINAILDERVRPALAGDGGGLQVIGLNGKNLHIRYEGACGTCPSSISGTLTAIEDMLQTEIDKDLSVVPG